MTSTSWVEDAEEFLRHALQASIEKAKQRDALMLTARDLLVASDVVTRSAAIDKLKDLYTQFNEGDMQ